MFEANDEEVKEVLSNIKDIHQLFIVSEAVINESHPDAKEYKYTKVHVEKHPGDKCNRCWTFSETVGTHEEYPDLCTRCYDIVVENFSDLDRKSTRLNSSHVAISYAVFCLKKK